MKTASILTIGSEIVEGVIFDRNSSWLSAEMKKLGYAVKCIVSVGDKIEDIVEAVKFCLRDVNVLLVTGGLGPTKDDLTREAVSRALGRPLVFDEGLYERVAKKVRDFAGKVVDGIKKEAMLIDGALPLENDVGSAPGQFIEQDGKKIVIMPGPPREMMDVFEKAKAFLEVDEPIYTKTLKFYGVRESVLEDDLKHMIYSDPRISVATQADYVEGIKIRFTVPESLKEALNEILMKIRSSKYSMDIYAEDDESMEERVVRLLSERGESVAVAESCTGGLLSGRLVNVPGASRVFKGGIIAYDNEVKISELGVSKATLEKYGAVSERCVEEMLKGLLEKFNTDWGIAVSGIAGPEGGTAEKPVGTVYIGLINRKEKIEVRKHNFRGERNVIRAKSVMTALDILRRSLMGGMEDDER